MSRIFTKTVMVWNAELGRYDYSQCEWFDLPEGAPLALCCGASHEQKQIEAAQAAYYTQLTAQANQVFGMAAGIFKDLQSTFAPILAKGPSQEGFSAEEKQNLENEITNDTGAAYHKAANALNAQIASQGGGDVPIISGNQNQVRQELAQSAASQEAAEREQVIAQDYATGRQNFLAAASALSGAPNVFGAATSMANAATGAGSAAANTADQIAAENNSWVNATIGALGGIASSAATGGFDYLSAKKKNKGTLADSPMTPPVLWGEGSANA